jgi:hypothetical protein
VEDQNTSKTFSKFHANQQGTNRTDTRFQTLYAGRPAEHDKWMYIYAYRDWRTVILQVATPDTFAMNQDITAILDDLHAGHIAAASRKSHPTKCIAMDVRPKASWQTNLDDIEE